MHYCANFSKEKVVGVISVLVLNPEHWFKSMETWPTQDRYTEQHSLRSDEDFWKGRCFKECFWGMGGGQVSVVYELAWLSDRGEVWRRGGEQQPCAFEMEVCDVEKSSTSVL